MSRYTHILFDHDGVLVDTEHLYYQATRELLATLGVDLTLEKYLALQADGANAWAQAEAQGVDSETVRATKDARNVRYQELLVSEPIDIPGVPEVLMQLKQRCGMAIVTTAKPADFNLIHYGLPYGIEPDSQPIRDIVPHMAFVLTNTDYERAKPHPDPYLMTLERFNIEAGQALVVEDSERGLKSAVAAGIDCATVEHPFTASQNFSTSRWRLGSLLELLEIVDG